MMVLKKSAARMVTISSWAAAMASGEGVCARAGPAADKQTTTQAVSIHECLRMKILLWADVSGSYLIAVAAGAATQHPHARPTPPKAQAFITLPQLPRALAGPPPEDP